MRLKNERTKIAHTLGAIAAGCVVIGLLYILTYILLGLVGFTHDATLPGRPSFPLQSANKIYVIVFSAVLFLIPFTLGAIFLRFFFCRERRAAGRVTAGLLTAWAGEKAAVIWLSALIYGMPLNTELLQRIHAGGDPTAPWFTPVYHVLTFLGCILLGQVFGWIPVKGKGTSAA